MPVVCTVLDIGPNLSSFLVQLLLVLGGLAAAYRGQSIVKEHANRPNAPGITST
jgi:hypothetical protein